MDTQSQTSPTRKTLYGIMLVGMILSLIFGVSGSPSAQVQEAEIDNSTQEAAEHKIGSHHDPPTTWILSFDSPNYAIEGLETFDGKLYACGFDANQTNGKLFEFNGIIWKDMNFETRVGVTVDLVHALQVFDNLLYIGTRVDVGGIKYVRVYSYDGTNFTRDLSRKGMNFYSGIEDLTVHNNTLYAANGSRVGEVYKRIG